MTEQYSEDQIITLDFDDGASFDCGIMGIFDVEGKDYIALRPWTAPRTSISTAISPSGTTSSCWTSTRRPSKRWPPSSKASWTNRSEHEKDRYISNRNLECADLFYFVSVSSKTRSKQAAASPTRRRQGRRA